MKVWNVSCGGVLRESSEPVAGEDVFVDFVEDEEHEGSEADVDVEDSRRGAPPKALGIVCRCSRGSVGFCA
jgi:hypothetical protein